jgi:tetratricopeptide (TPR) repeat protein
MMEQKKKGVIKGLEMTIGGRSAVVVSRLDLLNQVVDQMPADGSPCWISLSGPIHDSILVSGGNNVYYAEWEEYSGGEFRTWVAGLPGVPSEKKVSIPTKGYQERVRENECLGPSEVKTILLSFAKGKGRPNQFVWRETTNDPKIPLRPEIIDRYEPADGCFVDSSAERRPIILNEPEFERRPAKECAICGKTLKQTGGRRLLIPGPWTEEEIKACRGEEEIFRDILKGERAAEIAVKGHGLTEESLKQMEVTIQTAKAKGLTPWVCQRCKGRTCKECGEPLVTPPFSGILNDDGIVSYVPMNGLRRGCINPKCLNYKRSEFCIRDKEIIDKSKTLRGKRKGTLNDAVRNWSEADLNLHRQLLQKLMANKEFPQAKIVAEHLTDLQPEDANAWYHLGVILLSLSNPRDAESCLARSMRLAGKVDGMDCYQMSQVRLLLGDLGGAVRWSMRAIELDPENLFFRWKLMENHTMQGDLKAAIAVGKKSLKKKAETPDQVRTRLTLANLYIAISAYEEAEEQLNEALKLDAGNTQLWFMLGRSLSRQNKWEEALKAFQNAAEIDPHDPYTLYNIGDAFLGLGESEKAVDPLQQAVRWKHDFNLAHYDLSLAFLRLKEYEEAETAARAALGDDPKMMFQWSNLGKGATENLGIALMNQGRLEEAEACFRRNLNLIAPTHFNLGLTLFRMKHFEDALENFRRAVELNPGDPEYHNLLGQTYDQLGYSNEAEGSLRRSIELDRNYALGHYDLGVILAKREGRRREALEVFTHALKIDPNLEWAYYSIACLHALSQKEKLALSFLEKALRKGLHDRAYIEKDSDWDDFRTNSEFIRLLDEYC